MRIALVFAIVAIGFWGGTVSSVTAGAYDFLRDDYIEEGADHFEALENARAVLEGKPHEDWTTLEIQAYLAEALWVVYCGVTAYSFDLDQLPVVVDNEALCDYIEGWPANPFNNWEPMIVLSDEDDFAPGSFVWQVCPPEYWSIAGPIVGTERPMSYELSVSGPTALFGELGNAEPVELNEWAVVPTGAFYMLGSYCESAEITRSK